MVLDGETVYNDKEIIKIRGINAEKSTQTLGSVKLNLLFNGIPISNKMHLLPRATNVPLDGLIGNDFLRKVNAKINYSNNTLCIGNSAMPIYFKTKSSDVKNNNSVIIVQARTETLVEFNVLNPEIGEGLVPEIEIMEGVYLCRSITKVNSKSKAITSILNTTEKAVKVKKMELILEKFYEKDSKMLETDCDDRTIKRKVKCKNKNVFQFNKITENIDNRYELLKSSLRTEHLNKEEGRSLFSICRAYNDIFHLEGDILSQTNSIRHEINTTTQTPIHAKTYRYPEVHKREVNDQIKKMLDQRIIKDSNSAWSSPLWVVPKKKDATGQVKYRVVIDYRNLNEVTIGDAYNLPNITEILDQLGHSKYFTTLDLASGFHQIPMKPEDSHKTAFSTPLGHYEFLRMPFGLKNAPATFQRVMNNVLAGIQGIRCFAYLDDIVIYADTIETHEVRLKEVFQKLRLHNLKLQPDKCEFMRNEVMYLGHVISENGVKPNPDKIQIIKNYPIPKNPKDIKSFLGLAGYYRRFIKDFSKNAQPLSQLLKKDIPFIWKEKQQESFDILRNHLIHEPILQFPDFSKTFNVTTDASNFAIGAVLSQGEISKDLPISFASRTLNKAESNYSTTERELLAIIYAVKHFRPYLYGVKFNIITDHRPLVWLFNTKDPGSRLLRWRLKLEEYQYNIIYKPGKLNSNADALSRIDHSQILHFRINPEPNSYEEFIKSHYKDKTIIDCKNIVETDESLLTRKDNLCNFISNDKEMSEGLSMEIRNLINNHDDIKKSKTNVRDILYSELNNIFNTYHLITMEHFWDKPTYEDIFYCFLKLKNVLISQEKKSLSIPELARSDNNLNWNKIKTLVYYVFANSGIMVTICKNKISHPDPKDITKLIEENHDSPQSGHSGFHRTYNRIKERYTWKNMKKDIRNYIRKCESCQKNKISRRRFIHPMEITTTSEKPFERISLDIVGPLPLSENGNKYILTLQDDLTKFSQAFPIPNHEAITIAKELVNNFICKFGIPNRILTDQGKDFTSNILKEVAKLFKIKQIQTTAYHPQSNGALERSHATLADYLKHYISEKQTDWDEWINLAMFSYNTTPHTSTRYTPYELIFGLKPELPTSLTQKPQFKYTYDNYVDNLKLKLNKSQEIAREHVQVQKIRSKENFDKNISSNELYNVNDLVYLRNETTKSNHSKKLSPNYQGPYRIVKINSKVNCTILVKKKYVKVHFNRLKKAIVSD